MFHVFSLSWNNSSCLYAIRICICTIHVQSLSVPPPFMLLGRRVTKQQREPYCLYSAVLERTGLSVCLIDMYVGNPALPLAFSFSQCLPSSAHRRMVKRRLSWWITSGLCFAFWHPKCSTATTRCFHYSVFQLFPLHFSISHRHWVHRRWNMILLFINDNGN